MPARSIRARVKAGHLEPLEELHLEEGSEIRIILELPEGATAFNERPQLDTWDLGAMRPLTRSDIYEDVIG